MLTLSSINILLFFNVVHNLLLLLFCFRMQCFKKKNLASLTCIIYLILILLISYNNFVRTDPKEMEICNLTNKKFKIVVLRKLSELQENTKTIQQKYKTMHT